MVARGARPWGAGLPQAQHAAYVASKLASTAQPRSEPSATAWQRSLAHQARLQPPRQPTAPPPYSCPPGFWTAQVTPPGARPRWCWSYRGGRGSSVDASAARHSCRAPPPAALPPCTRALPPWPCPCTPQSDALLSILCWRYCTPSAIGDSEAMLFARQAGAPCRGAWPVVRSCTLHADRLLIRSWNQPRCLPPL